ncbi:MAG: ABC transporter permease [Bacteroidota bacterium]|jgi:putative ABC transport system permease protein
MKTYVTVRQEKGRRTYKIISSKCITPERYEKEVSMLKNYLKIALRNILKFKVFSFINIFGLSAGVACCIVIMLYVVNELDFDKYHEFKDRIYRVAEIETADKSVSIDPVTAPPLVPALKADYPDVEAAARIYAGNSQVVRYNGKTFYEEKLLFADQDLFEILTIPFTAGKKENALTDPFTLVLTEKTANKYFGTESPVGKTVQVDDKDFRVTALVADPPGNTHLKYSIIASMKSIEKPVWNTAWMYQAFYSYLKLKPGVDAAQFGEKIYKIGDRYAKDKFDREHYSYSFFLQPVRDLHLYPCPQDELETPGDPARLYIFSAIGLLVLLIACINFMNLATARSMKRAKEIGTRKVLGANRSQLIVQFLGESFFMSALAMLMAIVMVGMALPFVSALTGGSFTGANLMKYPVPVLLIAAWFVVGLLSGSYPAVYLSGLQPAGTLKGFGRIGRGLLFKRTLLVGQFVISVVLIIGSFVIYDQLEFMKNHDLGFSKEQKLILPLRGRVNVAGNYETIKSELLGSSGIRDVSFSSEVPGEVFDSWATNLIGEADAKTQSVLYTHIDHEFLRQYDIGIIAGRGFVPGEGPDVYIFNESALRSFGWSSPGDAVGKRMMSGWGRPGMIIGVCRNFNFQGLQHEIAPLILSGEARFYKRISLSMDIKDLNSEMAYVERKWKELFPGKPFEYFFLDESFDRQYRSEQRAAQMCGIFTGLGVLIACLGLFGLAAFMAEQRTKEIGIRKTLGATVPDIVMLFAGEFMKWVLLADLIAWPLAYWLMNRWLLDFAYRTGIGIGVFALSGAATLAVALLTVSYQAVRSATANPVNSLKYE